MRREAGFTLIELLLALGISAMIAVVAYGGLSAAISADAGLRVEVARVSEVQAALDLLATDLMQLQSRNVISADGVLQSALLVDARSSTVLALTRSRAPLPQESGVGLVQRVNYLWHEGRLWRRHWAYADAAVGVAGAQATLVLEAVRSVELRVLPIPGDGALQDFDLERLPGGWESRWDSALRPPGQPSLPLALEVTLVLDDLGEVRRVFALPQ